MGIKLPFAASQQAEGNDGGDSLPSVISSARLPRPPSRSIRK